ncbi:MAG: methyltransferase domain-containing protein [Candidatus Paceibacterota bacterium]
MSFADPQTNLQSFGLEPGMEVADLGAGPGHYTLAAARMVGEKGHVCAVEIQKDLVEKVKNQAEREGLTQVDVVWSDLEKPGGSMLDDTTVDVVILSNVLFQVKDKDVLLAEAARILRSGGRALVIDWSDTHGGLGPPEDHLISIDELKQLAASSGLQFMQKLGVGAHHWGAILQKS